MDVPPPSYEQTISAIVQCGIARANVRIAYEDILQSDHVTISDLGSLSEQKLRCLKAAVHPFYILTMQDQSQQNAFDSFLGRENGPVEQAKAKDWLSSRKLNVKMPIFDSGKGLRPYAEALEVACGLRPGTMLMVDEPATLTVRPDFLRQTKFQESGRAIECLTNLFAASDATEKGVRLGFIGNEAFTEKK